MDIEENRPAFVSGSAWRPRPHIEVQAVFALIAFIGRQLICIRSSTSPWHGRVIPFPVNCGARSAQVNASRTPVHACGGTGGWNRVPRACLRRRVCPGRLRPHRGPFPEGRRSWFVLWRSQPRREADGTASRVSIALPAHFTKSLRSIVYSSWFKQCDPSPLPVYLAATRSIRLRSPRST